MKGGEGPEYCESCGYYVTTQYLSNTTLTSSASYCSVAFHALLQAPAFPAATNFRNSAIDNNLRNARKPVSPLPSLHRHLYSVQLAVFIYKEEVYCRSLKVKTYPHRPTANGTEGVSSFTAATERCAMAGGVYHR
jgi:hypothetical protein